MKNRVDIHPLTGEITLMTPNRLERPNALLDHDRSDACPFCPGMERETPPEVDRVEADGQWLVRVVPNKFPIASIDSGINGVHEVVVESPGHDDELRSLSPDHRRAIVDVWLRRIDHARSLPDVKAVILFRNRGPHAGESIPHPHTQILGIPFVPERIGAQRGARAACALCEASDALLIETGGYFTLRAATTARLSHQLWIVPTNHAATPDLAGSARDELAAKIASAERLLIGALGEVSMNWALIQAPVGVNDYHWYLEVSPRVTGIAGFELATGCSINLIPPEESARVLRELKDGS